MRTAYHRTDATQPSAAATHRGPPAELQVMGPASRSSPLTDMSIRNQTGSSLTKWILTLDLSPTKKRPDTRRAPIDPPLQRDPLLPW